VISDSDFADNVITHSLYAISQSVCVSNIEWRKNWMILDNNLEHLCHLIWVNRLYICTYIYVSISKKEQVVRNSKNDNTRQRKIMVLEQIYDENWERTHTIQRNSAECVTISMRESVCLHFAWKDYLGKKERSYGQRRTSEVP